MFWLVYSWAHDTDCGLTTRVITLPSIFEGREWLPCDCDCDNIYLRTVSGPLLHWANQWRLRLWTRLMQIDNLNVSALCAFNSNTNADGWASHRASFRCFGNALADEPGHLPIGGLTCVSLHSQIYYNIELQRNALCSVNHWNNSTQADAYSWLWKSAWMSYPNFTTKKSGRLERLTSK